MQFVSSGKLTPSPKRQPDPASLASVIRQSLCAVLVESPCRLADPVRHAIFLRGRRLQQPFGDFDSRPQRFRDAATAKRIERHCGVTDRNPTITNDDAANARTRIKSGPAAMSDSMLDEFA